MGPHPAELRQRVVEAYGAGEGSMRELADRFMVSFHFVFDMVHLAQTTGALAPRPHGGGPSPALDATAAQALRTWVLAHNDALLREIQQHVADVHGVVLSLSRLCRLLQRLGLPRKKRRSVRTSATGPTSSRRGSTSPSGSSASTRTGWSSSMSSG
jgi:transposase